MPTETIADPFPSDTERVAAAVERAYQGLVAGTLRTKRLPPERMALILVSIADSLLDSPDDSD